LHGTIHKDIDVFEFVHMKKVGCTLFYMSHTFLETFVKCQNALEVIIILCRPYKSLFFICMTTYEWTLPKNVDEFRLPLLPKLKRTGTLYSICQTDSWKYLYNFNYIGSDRYMHYGKYFRNQITFITIAEYRKTLNSIFLTDFWICIFKIWNKWYYGK